MHATRRLKKPHDSIHVLHSLQQHLSRRVQRRALHWLYKKARVPRDEVWSTRALALHFFNSVTTDERSLVGSGGQVLAYELSEWQRASVRLRDAGGWLIGSVLQDSALERAITKSIAAALLSRWDTGVDYRESRASS